MKAAREILRQGKSCVIGETSVVYSFATLKESD